MDFIVAASNLRAENYGIAPADRHKVNYRLAFFLFLSEGLGNPLNSRTPEKIDKSHKIQFHNNPVKWNLNIMTLFRDFKNPDFGNLLFLNHNI